ncbi:flavoprotein [Streptomyces alkaliphilus]|uniref:Flavoprotein n=1 Tax=Streptomyces alkaliphilus TaxID=1472722 RepID=A0A7W3Y2A8_9ACTN|nr:flavoprotein [Streptomyces alkaliphilus]MBB0245353.1 flavoprotein [Streptomyces alkaliphilus]
MRTIYLLGCAAPPVFEIVATVNLYRADDRQVCVALTPTAAAWLGEQAVEDLEHATGHPVRTRWRRPDEPKGGGWPAADGVILAPATLHTINALALGLTHSHVVGIGVEMMGRGVPLVVLPCVNTVLARHPRFGRSVAELREAGVRVLLGDDGEEGFVPNEPGSGIREYPWELALRAVTP